MDELWQRHKTFILQCLIGGLVFLIALVVMGNTFDGIEGTQKNNASLVKDLQTRVSTKQAPSKKSIDAQRRKAEDAQQQIRSMGAQVASLATGEAYVRENVRWVFSVLGRPAEASEEIVAIFRQIPQSSLTKLRSEAQAVLGARAAQRGKTIDETFGLSAGVDDENVPGGMHALAILCDVIRRVLDREGIASVGDFKVNPGNVLDRDLGWISGVEIRLALVGDPDDVMAVIRSFNTLDSQVARMTVLKEVESITRRSPDDDAIRAVVVLYGLRLDRAEGDGQ